MIVVIDDSRQAYRTADCPSFAANTRPVVVLYAAPNVLNLRHNVSEEASGCVCVMRVVRVTVER